VNWGSYIDSGTPSAVTVLEATSTPHSLTFMAKAVPEWPADSAWFASIKDDQQP
jgi:hypothetical protein